jgi:uncharacterized protein YwqG
VQPDTYVKHTEMEIPIGHSRYGGPVIDLPKEIEHPKDLRYAGQLDLAKLSPFDKTELLPKTGRLIFFADILKDTGQVIYADVPNDSLIRTIYEHEDNFFLGVLVDKVFTDEEVFADRFREAEDEWDKEHANEDGKLWDDFAGSDISKIFGIYTHCQYGQEQIEKITCSDNLLLLQVGENGFNDEGVFSVLISRQDLINKNFDHCEFAWKQS